MQRIINQEVLLHGFEHVCFSYSYMLEICRHFRKLKWSMSQSLLSLMMEWMKNLERFLANSVSVKLLLLRLKESFRPFFLCNIDFKVILFFCWEKYGSNMMH